MVVKPNAPALLTDLAYTYLDRAQQLLAHGWVKGREAVDKDGISCAPESDLAVAYCEIGAIKAVTHYDQDPDAAYRYVMSILSAANAMVYAKGSVPSVNDSQATTQEYVLRMFDKAKNYLTKHMGGTH